MAQSILLCLRGRALRFQMKTYVSLVLKFGGPVSLLNHSWMNRQTLRSWPSSGVPSLYRNFSCYFLQQLIRVSFMLQWERFNIPIGMFAQIAFFYADWNFDSSRGWINLRLAQSYRLQIFANCCRQKLWRSRKKVSLLQVSPKDWSFWWTLFRYSCLLFFSSDLQNAFLTSN